MEGSRVRRDGETMGGNGMTEGEKNKLVRGLRLLLWCARTKQGKLWVLQKARDKEIPLEELSLAWIDEKETDE